ncbi:hypothetical protein IV203_023321 [Nitzschia inconspicua]|uniref:Uncharacterized protein n=1 Tax=Nitzschia inconspicua TaxID=303405 RepID=A0A9K3KDY0_9STRA|nr:hypothetical protein IV203_023321 [Nitzschia inconspicua]
MLLHPRETLPLSLPVIPLSVTLGPSHPRRTSAYVRRLGASRIELFPARLAASECFFAFSIKSASECFSAFSNKVPVLSRVCVSISLPTMPPHLHHDTNFGPRPEVQISNRVDSISGLFGNNAQVE